MVAKWVSTVLLFHKYFLNMDISLIMRLICLKIVIHVLRIHLQGKVSQNFDIGLSFNLVAFRKGAFKKFTIKSHKLVVFCSKIKTRTEF